MVAPARPRIRFDLRIVAAVLDGQRFLIFYRDGQRWRAKAHVMRLVLRGIISFAHACELWRSIK